MVPPHVEEIGRNPEILEFLSQHVKVILWAGGDVSTSAGNAISSKLKLFTTCGSTEMGMWPTIRPSGAWPSTQWKFMRIHPAANLDFRHRSGDLYEAFICRNPDPEQEQPIFKVFPHEQEFSSGDLFSPVKGGNEFSSGDLFSPVKGGNDERDDYPSSSSENQLWQYRGRADDMQVFRSGEKYHPVSVEQHIAAKCADVQEALMVGTGRPQAALILEMRPGAELRDKKQQEEFLDRIWPVVEEANLSCPAYAVMKRDKVLFTDSTRPMGRAAKGTVQRSATVQLYEKELDELFD